MNIKLCINLVCESFAESGVLIKENENKEEHNDYQQKILNAIVEINFN